MNRRKPKLPNAIPRAAMFLQRAGLGAQAHRVRTRECGSCQACCESGGERPYLPPPHHTTVGPCPLLAATGGCSIYPKRPAVCAEFLCGWRLGMGEPADRPDRSGWLVFAAQEEGIPGWRAFELVKPLAPSEVPDMLVPYFTWLLEQRAEWIAVQRFGDPERARYFCTTDRARAALARTCGTSPEMPLYDQLLHEARVALAPTEPWPMERTPEGDVLMTHPQAHLIVKEKPDGD